MSPKYQSFRTIRGATLLADTYLDRNRITIAANGSEDTIVEYKLEMLYTFQCQFEFSNFPFDEHFCKFRFGRDRKMGILFRLFDPSGLYHLDSRELI